jgi:hypothetical protein
MAVKRDYGSFAKASTRLLAPRVESLGYRPWYGGGFGQEKSDWVEGFFLQQSQWGSGDFCVTMGIHVPRLEEFWALDPPATVFGLLIGWRLNEQAAEHGGDMWYHAKNTLQLENALNRVADLLAKAEPWFEQFRSFKDVVEQFRLRSGLPTASVSTLHSGVLNCSVLNYGLLLMLDNDRERACDWLLFAKDCLARPIYRHSETRTFTYEKLAGSKIVKPTKDHELRKRVVEAALARFV